jgi:hypothetical protein
MEWKTFFNDDLIEFRVLEIDVFEIGTRGVAEWGVTPPAFEIYVWHAPLVLEILSFLNKVTEKNMQISRSGELRTPTPPPALDP